MEPIQRRVGRIEKIFRSIAAYLSFAIILGVFCRLSDYAPDWSVRNGGDPPQYEGEILTFVLVVFTPFITAMIYLGWSAAGNIGPRLHRLSWINPAFSWGGRALAVFLVAGVVVPFVVLGYIRRTSCCPLWQAPMIGWGLGLGTFFYLVILFAFEGSTRGIPLNESPGGTS